MKFTFKIRTFSFRKYFLLLLSFLYFITNSLAIESATFDNISQIKISCLNKSALADINKNPKSIYKYYIKYKNCFTRALGYEFLNLNDMGKKIAFASIVAYKLKPYGTPTTPPLKMNKDLQKNLLSQYLSCASYVRLTYELYQLIHPITPIKIFFVGWNGGSVGNHAQIFTQYTGIPLLLDPTIGLIARSTFDQVASGKKISIHEIKSFYSRTDINAFNEKVINSLLAGEYKPSDLLYFFQNLNDFWKKKPQFWSTPQALNIKI